MLSLERQNELRRQYQQAHPGWRPATELYAECVRRYLRPDTRLLDLGCGRGGLVEQLEHPLTQVVGLDPDHQSLREHRLDLPRVSAYSHELPFANQAFDLICASWLLEHLERPELTFDAISQVLRPGGVFIFITPNGRHPLALLNRTLGRFVRLQAHIVEWFYGRAHGDSFPTHYRANTASSIREVCRNSGLRLIELSTVPDPTYLAFTPALFQFMAWLESRMPPERYVHLVGVMGKSTERRCP